MARKIQPCSCGSSNVTIAPTSGGRGSGDFTSYDGICHDCGLTLENLGGIKDGRKDGAIADWNRLIKLQPPRTPKQEPAQPTDMREVSRMHGVRPEMDVCGNCTGYQWGQDAQGRWDRHLGGCAHYETDEDVIARGFMIGRLHALTVADGCPLYDNIDRAAEPDEVIIEQMIATCIYCGCDDLHACMEEESGDACYWIEVDREKGVGVCSCCEHRHKQLDLFGIKHILNAGIASLKNDPETVHEAFAFGFSDDKLFQELLQVETPGDLFVWLQTYFPPKGSGVER